MNIDLSIEDFFQSDNKNFENLIIDVNGAEYILKNIMNYKEIIHLKKIKREILIRLFDNDTLIGFCSYQIKKDEEPFRLKNQPLVLWLDIKNENRIKNCNLKIKIKFIVKNAANIFTNPSFNTNHLLINPHLTKKNQNSKNLNLFKNYVLNNNYLEKNDDILNNTNLVLNKYFNKKDRKNKNQLFKSTLFNDKENNVLNYSDGNADCDLIPNKLKTKNIDIYDLDLYNKIPNIITSNKLSLLKVNMKTIENNHNLEKSKNKNLNLNKYMIAKEKRQKNFSVSNRYGENQNKNLSKKKILDKKVNKLINEIGDITTIINNKNKLINQRNITNINDKILYNNINYNFNYGKNVNNKKKINFKKINIKLSKVNDIEFSQENSNNLEFREKSFEYQNNYAVENVNEKSKNYLLINLDDLNLSENEEDINYDFESVAKDFDLLYASDFISNINKDLLKLEFHLCFNKILLLADCYNKKMKNLIKKNCELQKTSNHLVYDLVSLQKLIDKLENKKKLKNFKQNLNILKKKNIALSIKDMTSEKLIQKNLFRNYLIKDNCDNNYLVKKQNNKKDNIESKFNILAKILNTIILKNPNYISLLNSKTNKDVPNIQKLSNIKKDYNIYNINSLNINNDKIFSKSQQDLLKHKLIKDNYLNIKETDLFTKHNSLLFSNKENESNNYNRINTLENYRTRNNLKNSKFLKQFIGAKDSLLNINLYNKTKINKKRKEFIIYPNDNLIMNTSEKILKENNKPSIRKKLAKK